MKITFHGAAGQVTGSKHLIELKNGKTLLLDCGFFQGRGGESHRMNRSFPFDPSQIDYMVLSHAHIDHSGNIPTLVKRGFNGKIFCTPATLDLVRIMLLDSAFIQEQDITFVNKRREKEGLELYEPLYTTKDAEKCMEYFTAVPYNEHFQIDEDIELLFTDAGHILGSAVVNLTVAEGSQKKRICFSGDIGRYINKILRRPDRFPQADTIICESTYGDRLHETVDKANEVLMQAVMETCVVKKGKLIIPAFSIGKTQELVFALNKLEFEGKLPKVKVFVDSPLAVNATDIFRNHTNCFSEPMREFMKKDSDPFGFNGLEYVRDVNRSKALNELKEPCIIISASGMADAGRIKHHLINNIGDQRNSILFIGYCEPSSLGGRILRGDMEVKIFGDLIPVRADIYRIDFFSAHGDYNEILQFLSCQDPQQVEHFFLVHGDTNVLNQMQERLYDKGFSDVIIPSLGQGFFV